MRPSTYVTALNGLLLGWLSVTTACTSDNPGTHGLLVVTTSDMQIPKDITHVGVQVMTASGEKKLERWYEVGGAPNQQLPGTIGIAPGKTDEPVTIRIFSRQDSKIKSVSEAVTTVPRHRTALLRMPIEWLSSGMVKSTGNISLPGNAGGGGGGGESGTLGSAGDPGLPLTEDQQLFAGTQTSCAQGKTPRLGRCVSSEVEEKSLPSYAPAKVFGGGTGNGDGNCFDTVGCFSSTAGIVIDDWRKCTARLDSGERFDEKTMSVGLITADGAGICGASGCVVPLDIAGTSAFEPGFTVAGGKVTLPRQFAKS